MNAVSAALQHVTIGVRDLDQAVAFYRDQLGLSLHPSQQSSAPGGVSTAILDAGNQHRLVLVSVTGEGKNAWLPDDLHVGYRHLGFQVQSVDKTAARLKAAQVPFTLDPLDATGDVRIAFFKDPEGNLLEVVEGTVNYHQRGEAQNPQRPDQPTAGGVGELRFDHIALSVSNLERSRAFYEEVLGFPLLGQLIFNDARGFTITYLKAGLGVLELFSFSVPTTVAERPDEAIALGFRRVGFAVDDLDAAAARLQAAGVAVDSSPEPSPSGARSLRFADPDGNPLELVRP